MALPPQVIDQLSREPAHTPGWSGRLLMFSMTLFFLALVGWVGLWQGYERYLNTLDAKLEKDLASGSSQVPKEKEASVVAFYSQLENLKTVLDSHVYATNLFAFLEANTHANVYFSKLDLVAETNKLVLAGEAKSVKDATEQAQIFQNNPDVKSAIIGNLTAGDTTWRFDLTLIMRDKFFFESKPTTVVAAPPLPAPTTTLSVAPRPTSTRP